MAEAKKQIDKHPVLSAISGDDASTSIGQNRTDEDDDNSSIRNALGAQRGKDVKVNETVPTTNLQRQVARVVSTPGAYAIAGPVSGEDISRHRDMESQTFTFPPFHTQHSLVNSSSSSPSPIILTATLVHDDENRPSVTLTESTAVLARAEPSNDERMVWQNLQQHCGPKTNITASRCHLILIFSCIAVLLILSGLGVGLALAVRTDHDDNSNNNHFATSNNTISGLDSKRKEDATTLEDTHALFSSTPPAGSSYQPSSSPSFQGETESFGMEGVGFKEGNNNQRDAFGNKPSTNYDPNITSSEWGDDRGSDDYERDGSPHLEEPRGGG